MIIFNFSLPIREFYIIAEQLVPQVSATLERPLSIITVIEPQLLKDTFYRHCFFTSMASPLVPAKHVSAGVGTGLVHSCYAHGFDDYKIAIERNEPVECYVDEEGKYTRQMGYDLEGKDVLGEGSKKVLNLLKKNVVHSYNFKHSYPYDWRTKKPVIIRASKQWFIDVSEISKNAVEFVRNELDMDLQQKNSFISQLSNRPAWCISRQRVWGVPIPALLDDSGDEVVTNSNFIRFVSDNIRKTKDTDYWWKRNVDDLVGSDNFKSFMKENNAGNVKNLRKSTDIMDVWMDSGVAWHTIGEDKTADVVVEGIDQFRGWFQSLILTNLASKYKTPFKKILVHGFSVDDKNKKMSKSEGNVIDPDFVTDGNLKANGLGVDGLRLWVAVYGSEGTNDVKLGKKVLEELELKLKQIRNIFKFLLGSLDGCEKLDLKDLEFSLLDKFIIHEILKFATKSKENLENYRFRVFINEFIQFTSNPLSSVYIVSFWLFYNIFNIYFLEFCKRSSIL